MAAILYHFELSYGNGLMILLLGILVSKSSVMFVVQFLIKNKTYVVQKLLLKEALSERDYVIASISQIVFVQNIKFSNTRDLKYFGRVNCAVKTI